MRGDYLYLLDGTCDALNQLNQDSVTDQFDSTLVIDNSNLTIGSKYYIKASRRTESCSRCSAQNGHFAIFGLKLPAPLVGGPDGGYTPIVKYKDVCGLDYVHADVILNQRHNPAYPQGVIQPATFPTINIPANATILAAYVWFVTVGNTSFPNLNNITFSNLTTSTSITQSAVETGFVVPGVYLGRENDLDGNATCWDNGTPFYNFGPSTTGYRLDVISAISPGINTCSISGLPVYTPFMANSPVKDTDGATLLVIYQDCNPNARLASMVIWDGIDVNAIRTNPWNITDATVPTYANNIGTKAFALIGDVEVYSPNPDPNISMVTTFSANSNIPVDLPANFWQYAEINNIIPFAPSAPSNVDFYIRRTVNNGDCNSVCALGYYFQEGNNDGLCYPNISSSSPTCEGIAIQFGNSTASATTWDWNFGDPAAGIDNTSTLQNPTHVYNTAGTYDVTLTLNNGCSNTITVVVNPAPISSFSGPTTTCLDPSTNTITYTGPILSGYNYFWSATNGIIGTPWFGSPYFTITNWGNATSIGGTIILTVVDANGCTSTSTFDVQFCCDPMAVPNIVNRTLSDVILYPIAGLTITGVSPNYAITGIPFIVNGTFTIDASLHLSVSGVPNMYMGPTAKIIVEPGSILTIDGTYVHAGCNYMWDRIDVTQAGLPPPLLQVINTSRIEDAECAIDAGNGGQYDLQNSNFNKNYVDVQVRTYSYSQDPGTVVGCHFLCDDYLLPPRYGSVNKYCFLISDLYHDIFIGDNNDFTQSLSASIHAESTPLGVANVVITSNVFHDICPFWEPPGNVSIGTAIEGYNNTNFKYINQNIISNCRIGLFGTGHTNVNNFSYNTVHDITTGVFLSSNNGNSFNVQFNTFLNGINHAIRTDANQNCISVLNNNQITNFDRGFLLRDNNNSPSQINFNNITDCQTGIYGLHNPSSFTTIKENIITTSTSNPAMTTAIKLWEPSITNSAEICNNTILDARIGIFTTNLFRPYIHNNDDIRLRPTPNSSNYCFGIFTQGCTYGDIEDNSVYSNTAYGNTGWDWWVEGIRVDQGGNPTTVRCNHTSDIGDGFLFMGDQQQSHFLGNSMTSKHLRGIFLGGGTPYTLGTQGDYDHPSDNTWDIDPANFYYAHAHTMNTSEYGYHLYVRPNNPTVYHPNPFITFSLFPLEELILENCNPYPPISYTTMCPTPIPNLIAAHAIVQDSIDWGEADEMQKHSAKIAVFRAIRGDSAMLADTILSSFADSLNSTSFGTLDTIGKLASMIGTQLSATGIVMTNVAISPADSIEVIMKDINNLLLQKKVDSEEDVQKLKDIARLCPIRYGTAVYSARVLLAEIDTVGTEYWNECELPPYTLDNTRHAAPNRHNITQQADYMGKLYPNPNNGAMELDYQIPENTKAIIALTDPLGQTVAKWNLTPDKNKFEIKVPGLTSGVYYYEISIEKRVLQKDKIIIIK